MNINSIEIKIVLAQIQIKKVEAESEINFRNFCRNAIESADKSRDVSFFYPIVDSEKNKLGEIAVAKIMAQEVFRLIRNNKEVNLKEINFCIESEEQREVFNKYALGYIDYIANKLKSPFLTVDAIIELNDLDVNRGGGIVIIERSNPPFGWALPGGFVDYGETLEAAVIREAKEETNLDITDVKQFHTYSDPNRDPRFHTVGTVYTAKAQGQACAGDDARGLKVFSLDELKKLEFAFDHGKIIKDYLKYKIYTS